MNYTSLRAALITGLLTCAAASAANSPDLDRVTAALDALRTSVNARNFSLLEPRLHDSFSYQGQDPDFSRMIMRQVVQGYPHDIVGISILSAAADGANWSISIMIEGPNGADQRLVRLGADYRIQQADIADIQLAGHEEQRAVAAQNPASVTLPDTLRFPFEIQDGQIVVQAAINGVSGNFLVDTGAQATTVNTAHFPEGRLQTFALDHGRPSGVGGALTNVRAARGLDLTWGDAHFEDLRGLALDLSHLEASIGTQVVGLIGYDILERFEIHFDYAAGLLTLYRLNQDNKPIDAGLLSTPKARIAFDMIGHLPVFSARVSGQELRLGLDSGAAEAMLAEKWEDPMAGQFEFVRLADMRGADKTVRTAVEVRFDSMAVNNVEYEDVVFRFSDILLAGGGKLDLDGMLGYQFLSARPTSINFRAREIGIW